MASSRMKAEASFNQEARVKGRSRKSASTVSWTTPSNEQAKIVIIISYGCLKPLRKP